MKQNFIDGANVVPVNKGIALFHYAKVDFYLDTSFRMTDLSSLDK